MDYLWKTDYFSLWLTRISCLTLGSSTSSRNSHLHDMMLLSQSKSVGMPFAGSKLGTQDMGVVFQSRAIAASPKPRTSVHRDRHLQISHFVCIHDRSDSMHRVCLAHFWKRAIAHSASDPSLLIATSGSKLLTIILFSYLYLTKNNGFMRSIMKPNTHFNVVFWRKLIDKSINLYLVSRRVCGLIKCFGQI